MRKFYIAILLVACSATVMAQSGTKSPYSQFGLGVLADQSTGFNRGMNGIGYAMREHNQIDYLNPAAYSAIDSLSFIFDAGVGLQRNTFEEKGKKQSGNRATFDYAVAAFRVAKGLGVSYGLLPYTNVGYSYSSTSNVNKGTYEDGSNPTYTNSYSGDGGLHQVFVGAGWEPFRGLSVGFNASYLWGGYNRYVINSYSETYVNTLSRVYKASVHSYKLDFGLQYEARVSRKDRFTLGLVYSLGHKLGADAECLVISTNKQTETSDTTRYVAENALALPHVFGAGLAWNHSNRIKLEFDYQLQKWSNVEFPQYTDNGAGSSYVPVKGLFTDRKKYSFGGEYCHNERDRSFFGRVHYRAGVSYASPYQKINGADGPSELCVSLGVGIPIINSYNNRSLLNISGQWVRQSAEGFVKENIFRINVGFTFNERWFAKFKVE